MEILQQDSTPSPLLVLPPEIVGHFTTYFTKKEIRNFISTCRTFLQYHSSRIEFKLDSHNMPLISELKKYVNFLFNQQYFQVKEISITGVPNPILRNMPPFAEVTRVEIWYGDVQGYVPANGENIFEGLHHLHILPALRELDIHFGTAQHKDEDFEFLPQLTQLDELTITANTTRGNAHFPRQLSQLTNLQKLELNRWINAREVSQLSPLTKLTSLNLGCCISLEDVGGLSALTNLTSLDMYGIMARVSLSPLKYLKLLRTLDVTGMRDSSERVHNLPYKVVEENLNYISQVASLRKLAMRMCHSGTSVQFSALTSLTALHLMGTRQQHNMNFISEIPHLSRLLISCTTIARDFRIPPTISTLSLTACIVNNFNFLTTASGLKSLHLHSHVQCEVTLPTTHLQIEVLYLAISHTPLLERLGTLPKLTTLYLSGRYCSETMLEWEKYPSLKLLGVKDPQHAGEIALPPHVKGMQEFDHLPWSFPSW